MEASGVGLASWRDADKVALASGLTLPFAVGWLLRVHQIAGDPALSTYVSRDFLPTILPFLWLQAVGHLLLLVTALAVRRRTRRRALWLVHAEVQFWFACLGFSMYAVGPFTSPFGVLMLVLPVVGYHLFEVRPMHLGLATMTVGTATAVALPALGVVRYAPFLDHAPFADGRLQPAWIASFGIPSIFAAAVGVAIHVRLVRRLRDRQLELERLTRTDSLTGLATRAVFFERLEHELARSRRHQLPLCVMMLDLDHFKAINDSLGHAAGDQVLRELGRRIRESMRTGDLAARYGGEEFALLLPHTALVDAEVVADRLVGVVRTIPIGPAAGAATTSLSVGLAELAGSEDGDALVARADAALYQAKRGGRDRVALAP